MASLFSDHNAPFMLDAHLTAPPVSSAPSRPWPLVRQTNDWINFFGDYPRACAEIINGNVQESVGRTGKYVTRHVLQLPVNSNILQYHPANHEVAVVQRDVQEKVERIYDQLEMFAENGLFKWKKTTGGAEIEYQGETVILHFKLCEETSMFHALISKPSRLARELIYPNMDNLSTLIYCLRMIFVSPGIFVSFDFELTWEDLQQASAVTFELSVIPPPQEEPEWMKSGESTNLSPDEVW